MGSTACLKPRDLILLRLSKIGVPEQIINQGEKSLVNLGEMSVGGVCNVVWGPKNYAYRCYTCGNGQKSSICDTCFQQGDHKDHDYRLLNTDGGRCDCGDEAAWKPSGFCSTHKGAQHIRPLPEEIACTVGPFLNELLGYWKEKLLLAQAGEALNDDEIIQNSLTSNVVEMLLEFCNHSESLLSFISRRVSVHLLDVLVRAERFLNEGITTKLHELLLKLLGDPVFKYEFAKVFITYYSDTINKSIKEGSEYIEEGSEYVLEKYKLIPTFPVQIFTVPTLTLRLVKERKLLGILFGCLKDLFSSCAGDQRYIQVSKLFSLDNTTVRLLGDTRFVLNHADVAKYATHEKPDISKTWIRLLAFVQGMDAQKRVTGLDVVEQNKKMHIPLLMGHSIANISSLLVNGAFSVDEMKENINLQDMGEDDGDNDSLLRPAKRSRHSQQSSVCSTAGRTGTMDGTSQVAEECSSNVNGVSVPSTVTGLTRECHKAIKDWLESESLGSLTSSDWPNIVYDVSSQDISVHIPLHRLLSLLLLKALSKCYGETGGSEINSPNSPHLLSSGECYYFFGQMLHGWHSVGFPAFIMEHPLRIKVFCAQVRAGMWQKNGGVAKLNCDWYRSEQVSELDIFLLQCCASLAPPDKFVKRILERFGLTSYLSLNPEKPIEHEAVLVQEMLTLIIQIIKERRFCGLSIAESLRRELVYKLAIKDATRSKLVESLPRDLSKNSQFQMILDSVADYSKPSGIKQGKYSLRKSCWKDIDLYHPRWNSKNLQVALERYLHFFKDSALAVQLLRWTKVFCPLNKISRIATSRALLEFIRAVLYYASLKDEQLPSRAPDGVLLIALHLLSLGLDICDVLKRSSGQEKDLLLAFASEEISGGPSVGSDAVKQITMLSLLVSTMQKYKNSTFCALIESILKKFAILSDSCAIKLHSDFSTPSLNTEAEERKLRARASQAAIMEKMKADQSKFIESNAEDEVSFDLAEESTPVVCSYCRTHDSKSPLSFLVLLQKSRLASFVERVPPVWGKQDKEYLSSTTCTEITEQRKRLQSGSGAASAWNIEQLVHNGIPVEVAKVVCTTNPQRPSTSCGTSMDTLPSSVEMMEVHIYQSVVKEMQNEANQKFSTEHDEEDLTEKRHAQCTLLEKYMASLSREKSEKPPDASRISGGLPAYHGFGPTDTDGIHISSCGHAVHHECHISYLSSLRERHIRQIESEGGDVVDPDQVESFCPLLLFASLVEFLCPQCRRLANSVLPAVSNNSSNLRKEMLPTSSGAGRITGSLIASGTNAFRLSLSLTLLRNASNNIGESITHISTLERNKKMQPTLEPILNILSRMYYPENHEKFLASGRVSHSMVLWDTLKYSLISTEIAARGVRSNMCSGSKTSTSGLEVLFGELKSSSEFILSLLLQVVQNLRNENFLQVLQRYRGVNLFAASICSGVSLDDEISPTTAPNGIGNIHVDEGVVYPDTQFWRGAADPVLSRDPFSSLMWILFSLPSPFLSSEDCFLCLVHLFYAVSVIQVLFTYIGKHPTAIAELGLTDCLISDLCKNVGGTFAKFYFVSNYNMDEASCKPKDMIRRMSHPYLRRCALLWKLLKSSTPEPFSDRSHERNRVSSNALESSLDDLSINLKLKEVEEVEELEQMFQIPELDVVLKDQTLRTLGLKWLNHFSREFDSRNYGRVLHSTPAVPFRLMRLPRLYQDLLDKYIKQTCPECRAVQNDPALCLQCGKICSASWVSCCRETDCQFHAMECGAGIAVYLLIKDTTFLVQRFARQAHLHSPFLNSYGEQDIQMIRGRPLLLNEERYAALTNMVASHGLDQISDVLHQTLRQTDDGDLSMMMMMMMEATSS